MAKIDIPGQLHSTATGNVVVATDEILDETANQRQSAINADTYRKEETEARITERLSEEITTPDVNYVSVDNYASLPATGEVDTIYMVASYDGTNSQVDASKYSIYAWDAGLNGGAGGYRLLAVRSAIDEVFDISAYNLSGDPLAPTTYADLAAALGTNGANVPVGVRKGGMSVKFISSSDNKYIRYNLLADSFTTDTEQWAVDDAGVYIDNPEWVTVYTDSADKILFGVKTNGKFYFGANCPPQVQTYVTGLLGTFSASDYASVMTFLGNLINGDTLATLLNAKAGASDVYTKTEADNLLNDKVDKVTGKSLIDEDYAASQSVTTNPEFMAVETDNDDKILGGRKIDGTKFENLNMEIGGILNINGASINNTEDIEGRLEIKTDDEDRILSYRDVNGNLHEMCDLNVPHIKAKGIDLDSITLGENAINNLKRNLSDTKSLAVIANTPISHPTKANGKEKYSELPLYNVERKACQSRYVRWELLFPIPTIGSEPDPTIAAGSKVGIPYSSAWETDKLLGYGISLLTYITAANNPYSMLYTENLRNNESAYGFTYYQPSRGTVGGWAGAVCSSYTSFATGMKIPWNTQHFAYLEKVGIVAKVYPQNAQGVRIGDIIWQSGHVRLVQNVWRDENGVVEKIEVSSGGRVQPEFMFNTPESFDQDLVGNNAIIYRYLYLYENDEYIQSAFPITPPTGEDYPDDSYSYSPDTPYVFNDDICTYSGDYACFREGFRIVLNYNLKEVKSWQSVELYKNNILYGTYLLSNDSGTYGRGSRFYPQEQADALPSHSFDLSSLNLTYGKYKARLVDSNNNYSEYTYFEIIETEVLVNEVDLNHINVSFSSSNGTPLYLKLSHPNGDIKAIYSFTQEDIAAGEVVINPKEMIKQQSDRTTVNNNLKVFFQGEYDIVSNSPITL